MVQLVSTDNERRSLTCVSRFDTAPSRIGESRRWQLLYAVIVHRSSSRSVGVQRDRVSGRCSVSSGACGDEMSREVKHGAVLPGSAHARQRQQKAR